MSDIKGCGKGLWAFIQEETQPEYKSDFTVDDFEVLVDVMKSQEHINPWEDFASSIEEVAKQEDGMYIVNGWYYVSPQQAREMLDAFRNFNNDIK